MDDVRAAAQTRCATVLNELSEERKKLFALRLDRWWPDLIEGLVALYDAPVTRDVALRVAELAATAYKDRDPDLHRLAKSLRTMESASCSTSCWSFWLPPYAAWWLVEHD